ncbi:MAG: enoyl-CoA hydratase/isomerase family protein [Euryarchaeota archaeon]|nr:enoyl-CoA hydratase/isomerase family protein [Euryarchaeota archaeon]
MNDSKTSHRIRLRDDHPDPLTPPISKELESESVLYETNAGVARVTLNRPSAYNSYTTSTLHDLARAVEAASIDDSVGVIVLTGQGTRAFCTGGDVKEYADRYVRRPRDYWKYMALFRRAVESLLRCGKPTIARLNGMAVGGGNELHLACDLSVAAEHAYLGQVGVGVGSVACGGATQWLPLAVGDRRARSMLLLNEKVPARRAEQWGLVSRVVPSVRFAGALVEDPAPEAVAKAQRGEDGYSMDLAPLDAAVAEMSDRLLQMFPECLRYTKEQTNFWKELAWSSTVGHGREWLTLHFATHEPYEGMTAFSDKRPPGVAEIRRRMAAGDSTEFTHGPPVKKCGSCGASGLPEDFTFCGNCGEQV